MDINSGKVKAKDPYLSTCFEYRKHAMIALTLENPPRTKSLNLLYTQKGKVIRIKAIPQITKSIGHKWLLLSIFQVVMPCNARSDSIF